MHGKENWRGAKLEELCRVGDTWRRDRDRLEGKESCQRYMKRKHMGKQFRGEEPGDLLHVRRREDGKSSQHKDLLAWTEPEPEDVDES